MERQAARPDQSSHASWQRSTSVGDFVETDLYRVDHGRQLVDVLRNLALLDSRPFGDLHTGPAGGLLDGEAGALRASRIPKANSRPMFWRRTSRKPDEEGPKSEEGRELNMSTVMLIYLCSCWPALSSDQDNN